MIEVRCGLVTIRVWPDTHNLDTVFDADHKVPAAANPTDPASVALAAELGYGTGPDATWHMTMEHETLYSWLSVQQGLDWSVTLHSVAWGYKPPRGIIPCEEEEVLAFQKYLNTTILHPSLGLLAARCGCSLPDLAERARAFLAQFGA